MPKQSFPLYGTTVWGQLGLTLQGDGRDAPIDLLSAKQPLRKSDHTQLSGVLFDEVTILPILQETNNLQTLCALYLAKTMLHYWFYDYEQAAVTMALAAHY